jgi:hypothetical protein
MYSTVASIFQQLILLAMGLVLPRVILIYYGSVVNGLTTSITQFINYFTLVEAGIGASAIFALYKPLASEDHYAISSIVTAAKKLYIQSGYIFTGLVVILAFCFPLIRKIDVLSPVEIGILVLVLGFSGCLNFFILSKFIVILTADQRSYIISIAIMVKNVVNAFIIVTLAIFHFNVVVAFTASLLSIPVQAIILYFYVRKKYNYLDYQEPNESALNRRWDALILQILGIIQVGAPIILATLILDYKAVSVYTIYYMVIGGLTGLLSIFTSGLSASFGDVLARGEKATLQQTYKEFEFTYYALITIVYSVALVLIVPFVQIYTKGIVDANYNVPIVGYLMVINGFLYNIKTPQGMLVISAGLYRETRWQTAIQGSIVIVVGAILAPKFGLAGILVGSILSNIYRDIDLLFFIPSHVTGLPPKATFQRWSISLLEFSLILFPIFFLEVKAPNYLEWLKWGVVATCYAAMVVCLFSFLFYKIDLKNSSTRILKMIGVKN